MYENQIDTPERMLQFPYYLEHMGAQAIRCVTLYRDAPHELCVACNRALPWYAANHREVGGLLPEFVADAMRDAMEFWFEKAQALTIEIDPENAPA